MAVSAVSPCYCLGIGPLMIVCGMTVNVFSPFSLGIVPLLMVYVRTVNVVFLPVWVLFPWC